MNIEKLGGKNTEQLVHRGLVKKLPDLFRLKPEKLEEMEGFAKKSARQLYDEIQKAKEAELHRFLYALGIRHVGEHISRLLASEFESLGGRATSSVSSNTDYLVKGENPGSKLDEAKTENVKIIDENQFKKLIQGD